MKAATRKLSKTAATDTLKEVKSATVAIESYLKDYLGQISDHTTMVRTWISRSTQQVLY